MDICKKCVTFQQKLLYNFGFSTLQLSVLRSRCYAEKSQISQNYGFLTSNHDFLTYILEILKTVTFCKKKVPTFSRKIKTFVELIVLF